MEFSSLREQRRNEVEARAAAAAAAEAEAEGSTSATTSSRRRTRTARPQQQGSSTPAQHTQPTEDGELPTAGLGSSANTSAQSEPVHTYDPPPLPPPSDDDDGHLRPHNLLRATEILQQQGSTSASFAPAPILRLNAIQIAGAAGSALRPGFLASMCRPYMDPSLSSQLPGASASSLLNRLVYGGRTAHVQPGQAATLPSILSLTSSLAGDLDKLDVFSSIEATLAPSLVPGAGEEDVDIVLNCGKPRGRVFLKSSTDVGNGEGSASVQGRVRNVFGGAETLQGSASFGTRTKQAFNVEFGAPLAGNVDNEVKVSGFSLERDLSSYASCSESVQGVRAALSTSRTQLNDANDGSTAGVRTQHEVAYEASLRHLGRLMPDASIAVRRLAVSPSVKSALSWTYTRDSRDDLVLPTRGTFAKTALEYAGLGGDASHVKAEIEASTGRCLRAMATTTTGSSVFGPVNATLGFRAGVIHALNGGKAGFTTTHFSDRFQLGGPTSVRMFRHNSLGPKSKTDSLGGDAFWSLGASLLTPVPGKQHWPIQLHSFLNAGQLCQLGPQPPAGWRELAQPSSSIGFGIVYLQGPLRVEFNAGLPITARTQDSPRKGLQFGIGIQFL